MRSAYFMMIILTFFWI